ncbi:MAG: sensor histidine kinase [Pseudomonadota bacterium]
MNSLPMPGNTLTRTLLRVHRFLIPQHKCLGYTPYLWLIYLGFPLLPLLFGTASPTTAAVTVIGLIIFLPTYFAAYRQDGTRVLPFIGVFVILGLFTAPVNMGSPVYFIFACSFAAQVGPPAVAMRYASLVVLVGVFQVWLLELRPSQALVTAVIGYMVTAVNVFYRKLELKNEALRLSREEIKRLARTAERERIARDLHDLLGHTLASITLKAELARRTVLDQPENAQKELAEIERISRQATAQVRAAVAGFRGGRIQSELASARQLLESTGIWLDAEIDQESMSAEHENILALVLREALTNVHRHSRASQCSVMLKHEGRQIRLVVRDDGRGGRVKPGSGISGMSERLRSAGGKLHIEANTPSGLIVQMTIPVSEPPLALAEPIA